MQESLNGDLDLPTSSQRVGDKPRVLLSSTTDPSTYNYRIAYEKPMERSEGRLDLTSRIRSELTLLALSQLWTSRSTRQPRLSVTTMVSTTLATQELSRR